MKMELLIDYNSNQEVIKIDKNDITNTISKTKNQSEDILKYNEITNPEIKNNILFIINTINKHKEIFSEYIEKYNELFNIKSNTIRLKYNFEKYINEFIDTINNNIDLWIEYQKIISNNWETEFNEALLRINWLKWFNHMDYLDIHNKLWKSIYVFYNVFDKILWDLNTWKINWKISINLEVKDIENPNFFKIINFLTKKHNINLKNQKIIFEILENSKLPNTDIFKTRIKKIKDLWAEIALDDILSNNYPLEEILNDLNFAGNNLDIVKLDWKVLQSFYSIYKTSYFIFKDWFKKLKDIFNNITRKWKKVVAEWIEDIDMLNFAKNILWIKYYQWFFSKNEENIKILQNNS